MKKQRSPNVVILAGPNGAGKSTTGPALLRDTLAVTEFVNADTIAKGLSAFGAESVSIQAGKIMLRRMRELGQKQSDFAFETTLASRSFVPWLKQLKQEGYKVHIVFLWLPGAGFAVNRVAERVRHGGHNVPETTIRRRYRAGISNFFELYQPLADSWWIYDNSGGTDPREIAYGRGVKPTRITEKKLWARIIEERNHGK